MPELGAGATLCNDSVRMGGDESEAYSRFSARFLAVATTIYVIGYALYCALHRDLDGLLWLGGSIALFVAAFAAWSLTVLVLVHSGLAVARLVRKLAHAAHRS